MFFYSKLGQRVGGRQKKKPPKYKYKSKAIVQGVGARQNTKPKTKEEQMCRAYKEWVEEHGAEQSLPSLPDLSAEQLFFLNFAQVLLHIDRCHTNLHFAFI